MDNLINVLWAEGSNAWSLASFDLLAPGMQGPNLKTIDGNWKRLPFNFKWGDTLLPPEPTRSISSPAGVISSPRVRIFGDYHYKYLIGLSRVEMGLDASGYRGVFVSKALPIRGGVGEVRMKTLHTNFEETNTSKHNPILTSVEYSVSNVSIPDKESDWIPILPINERQVQSERCFFNSAGVCRFRFLADPTRTIELFRNGYLTEFSIGQYLVRNEKGGVEGIAIPSGILNANDFYTCNYYPAFDPSIVNFAQNGQDTIVSTPFAKNGKVGERFTGTTQYEVQLSEEPYIDYSRVIVDNYRPGLGMESYLPVWVRFDDSSRAAFNVTNYRPNEAQSSLFTTTAVSSNVRFIHSGNVLLFDQVVTDPFTVYYHYLGDTLRFRAVLRCNTADFVSPTVDFVHIKAKTALPDALRG